LFCPHSEIHDLLRPAQCLSFVGRTATHIVTGGVGHEKGNWTLPYGSPYPQAGVSALTTGMIVPEGVYVVHINGFAVTSATGIALRCALTYSDDGFVTSTDVNYSLICGTTMTSGAAFRAGYAASVLVQVTQQTGTGAPVHGREYRLEFVPSASATLTDHDSSCLWTPA
jgi:hypothetical protein